MNCGACPLISDLKTIVFDWAVNKLFNGLSPKQFDKWSTWGIKAAIHYDSSSSILKFLQLVGLSYTTASPTEQQYQK